MSVREHTSGLGPRVHSPDRSVPPLAARVVEHGEHGASSEPLRALRYHDGLALIAEERRALHAVRRLLVTMLDRVVAASWPATTVEQRMELQREVRELVADLRDLAATAQFRGVRLLSGECPMLGVQAAPEATEFLVLGLRAMTPAELALEGLDLCTALGARGAREAIGAALDSVADAEEVLVADLHELF